MKQLFKPGDRKEFRKIVVPEDQASFHGEVIHPVCATFALARDIEWTTRQFVLDMREEEEEGVGTFLSIEHKSPAFVGEEIVFQGYVDHISGHELICFVEARVGDRLIAVARTGQKILKKEKIKKLFEQP